MSAVVDNNFVTSNIDEEDIVYLQKSLVSILYTTESNMYTSANQAEWCKDSVRLLCSSFGLQHDPLFDKKTNRVNGFELNSSVGSESDCISSQQSYDAKTLFGDFLNKGIDQEDIEYIKRGFNCCTWSSKEQNWMTKVCWDGDTHPPTADDTRDKCIPTRSDDLSFNITGCARSEGYIEINKLHRPRIKNAQRQLQPHTTSSLKVPKGLYRKIYKGNKQSLSRDARNYQRRLSTAYQMITDSNLLKLNELKFRKKKLRLGKSEIHGLGVFAKESIDPNEIIIEYVGQLIRPIISDLREKQYRSSGIGSYCFRLDDNMIIDATKYGNLNRYINHSCNPNSYSKILQFDNQKKIVIYAKKQIKVNEEITYDYKLPFEDDKIYCLCKAPGCRKSLN